MADSGWRYKEDTNLRERTMSRRSKSTEVCLCCGVEYHPHRDSRRKYCSNVCQREHDYQLWAVKVDKTGKFPTVVMASKRHHRYIGERQGKKCAICGRKTWLGQPIPLAFDHINGDHKDWRVSNCRLICNNCDALLPTYKGRNKGRGRKYRKKYHKSAGIA